MSCNFHTHRVHPGRLELVSSTTPVAPLCSLELHPWLGTTAIPDGFAHSLEHFAALGEVGFDRLHGAPLPDQLKLFDQLLQLAADCRKPVVIHAVGPMTALFETTKPYKLRLMLHGFRRHHPQLLEELVRRKFVVSLHPSLIDDPDMMKIVKKIEGRNIGLESDDQECYIDLWWTQAAEKTGIPDLARRGEETFQRFLYGYQ